MYYLIGKTLKHSKSKEIHSLISDIDYDYLELDDLSLLNRDFSGLNVTIPYKEEIIPYLDEIDELAARIGAVNTVVNNGKRIGYNTDYYGFKSLLEYYDVDVYQKRVLIIGTGGSSKTVTTVLEDLHVSSISYSSRSGMTTADVVDEYDIIINTTPKGMYPDEGMVLDVSQFHLEVAIDLIYNPLRTPFLQSANCKVINGLFMLVAQAVKAQELWLGYSIDKTLEVYKQLKSKMENIVLIGMPMSGKSTLGQRLANHLDKDFIDTDNLVEEFGTIDELIKEGTFRDIERTVIEKLKFTQGKVIATGGGVIINEENIRHLRYNGVLVYLKRDLEYLLQQDSENRPLLRESGALERLYNERCELYEEYADIIIEDEMEVGLIEHFSIKWG